MNWQEFKKEWQELPKARKTGLIIYTLLMLSTAMLIILGCTQFLEYTNEVQDSVKYCIGGVYITSVGFWLFNYSYTRSVAERMHRLREELEKAKGNGYLGEE